MAELAPLLVPRYRHGCGSYVSGGRRVGGAGARHRNDAPAQVLLVTGGENSTDNYFASTEVLTPDSSSWRMVGPLPRPMVGVAVASLDNMIFLIGTTYI